MAWLDRRPADMLACLSALSPLKIHNDPEFVFRVGWLLCDVGEHEKGLLYLRYDEIESEIRRLLAAGNPGV